MEKALGEKHLKFYRVLSITANVSIVIGILTWLNAEWGAQNSSSGDGFGEALVMIFVSLPLIIAGAIISIAALVVGWKVRKWKFACVPLVVISICVLYSFW
jgi:hypothetical protein